MISYTTRSIPLNDEIYEIKETFIRCPVFEDVLSELRKIVLSKDEEQLNNFLIKELQFPDLNSDEDSKGSINCSFSLNLSNTFRKIITSPNKSYVFLPNVPVLQRNFFERFIDQSLLKLINYYSLSPNVGLISIYDYNYAYVMIPDYIDRSLSSNGLISQINFIDLSSNLLTSIPKEFFNLTNLIILNLSSNFLEEIPDEVENLQCLKEFNLGFNRLKSLPESMGNLSRLLILNINNNRLTSLPESFGNLAKLTRLNASSNLITSVPNSFIKLKSIIEIDFKYNNISTIPSIWCRMRARTKLYFENNPDLLSLQNNINSISSSKTFSQNDRIRDGMTTKNSMKLFTPNFLSTYRRRDFLVNHFVKMECNIIVINSLLIHYPNEEHDCLKFLDNCYNKDNREIVFHDYSFEITEELNVLSQKGETDLNIILSLISILICLGNPWLILIPLLNYFVPSVSFTLIDSTGRLIEKICEMFPSKLEDRIRFLLHQLFYLPIKIEDSRKSHSRFFLIEVILAYYQTKILFSLSFLQNYYLNFGILFILLLTVNMSHLKSQLNFRLIMKDQVQINLKKDCEFCIVTLEKKRISFQQELRRKYTDIFLLFAGVAGGWKIVYYLYVILWYYCIPFLLYIFHFVLTLV